MSASALIIKANYCSASSHGTPSCATVYSCDNVVGRNIGEICSATIGIRSTICERWLTLHLCLVRTSFICWYMILATSQEHWTGQRMSTDRVTTASAQSSPHDLIRITAKWRIKRSFSSASLWRAWSEWTTLPQTQKMISFDLDGLLGT